MSEKSEDRSKRTFINNMKNNVWKKQFSVCFNYHSDSLNIIDHMKQVKRKLRKDFHDSAILYRVGLNNIRASDNLIEDMGDRTSVVMPYFTFFTSENIKRSEVVDSIKQALYLSIKILSKPIDEEKISRYVSSVKTQDPHDLKKYLAKESVNRHGIINKNKLIPIEKVSTPPAYAEDTKPRTGRPQKIIGKLK